MLRFEKIGMRRVEKIVPLGGSDCTRHAKGERWLREGPPVANFHRGVWGWIASPVPWEFCGSVDHSHIQFHGGRDIIQLDEIVWISGVHQHLQSSQGLRLGGLLRREVSIFAISLSGEYCKLQMGC